MCMSSIYTQTIIHQYYISACTSSERRSLSVSSAFARCSLRDIYIYKSYIYIYICIHLQLYTYVHITYMYIYIYIYTYIHMYTCVHSTYMYMCIHIYIYTCTRIYMYTYMRLSRAAPCTFRGPRRPPRAPWRPVYFAGSN